MMEKTKYLTRLSMFAALTMLLGLIPQVGYITIGPFAITTVHIPVILGAIMLGKRAGLMLGLVFGLSSYIANFYVVTPTQAIFFNPLITFLPRLLVGLFAAMAYEFLTKFDKTKVFALTATGVVGAITNTVFVLLAIYLFEISKFAQVTNNPIDKVGGVLLGIIAANGVPELVFAGILTAVIGKALLVIDKSAKAS